MGYHSGWRHPSWVDNDMTMISNPTHLPNRDIILDRISDGGNGHGNMVMNWTSDIADQNPHVSRRRHHARQAQARVPDGRERLDADRLLRPAVPDRRGATATRTPTQIHICYRYSDAPGGAFGVPTFSPDGNGLAWHAGDGIHVAAVPPFAADCTHGRRDAHPAARHPGRHRARLGPRRRPGRPHDAGRLRRQARLARHEAAGREAALGQGAERDPPRRRDGARQGHRQGPPDRDRQERQEGPSATASKTVRKAGNASLKLRVKRTGKVSVKVTFKPAAGAGQTRTITAKIR